MEPKRRKTDLVEEYGKAKALAEKRAAARRKAYERKMRRRPSHWRFEELDNPDHEWLEWERDAERTLDKPATWKMRTRVARYLRPSRKMERPEMLGPVKRKTLRLMIAEWMEEKKRVPSNFRLKKMYESVKMKNHGNKGDSHWRD